jgi:hypothetical protein
MPDARRIFLLSPASCGGRRAELVLSDCAEFDLAQHLRSSTGAPLGEVFSFLSGLYFRGKLAYATAFARPPRGVPGVLVITATRGLLLPGHQATLDLLREFADVDLHAKEARYRGPLERDARRLAERLPAHGEIVLLGSVATGKYLDVLGAVFEDRLRFPAAFVGRGDMSRGGLLLRCVRERRELEYVAAAGASRHGPRPRRLGPSRS